MTIVNYSNAIAQGRCYVIISYVMSRSNFLYVLSLSDNVLEYLGFVDIFNLQLCSKDFNDSLKVSVKRWKQFVSSRSDFPKWPIPFTNLVIDETFENKVIFNFSDFSSLMQLSMTVDLGNKDSVYKILSCATNSTNLTNVSLHCQEFEAIQFLDFFHGKQLLSLRLFCKFEEDILASISRYEELKHLQLCLTNWNLNVNTVETLCIQNFRKLQFLQLQCEVNVDDYEYLLKRLLDNFPKLTQLSINSYTAYVHERHHFQHLLSVGFLYFTIFFALWFLYEKNVCQI